ncbi:9826_t:CDS:2, partial [Funneliformis geosporum]
MPIMPKVNSKKQLNQTTNKQDEPLKKIENLANKYDIREGIISEILKEKDCWLSVDTNSYQANLK